MSKNKSIRELMIRKYGKVCMIEASGIRYIPMSVRKKIKGYKKSQETLTYHHLRERDRGGKATEENGAILKGYNHAWLHTLPEKEKQEVNKRLQEYKLSVATIVGGDVEAEKLEFDLTDSIELELLPQTEEIKKKRAKFNRAKEKEKFNRKVEEYYEERDDTKDY